MAAKTRKPDSGYQEGGLLSLRDEVMIEVPYKKREYILAAMGDEADTLLELLADPVVPPAGIWKALERRKIKVSSSAVHRWATELRASE